MPLDLDLSAVTEAEVDEVSRFLRSIFGDAGDGVNFRPDVVRWKSLEPNSLWPGSRGYVVRSEGKIVAHGCAMPARFLLKDRQLTNSCIIDWTADKAFPGTGVMIFRHIGQLTDGLMAVGGSDDSQKVLPRLGFKRRQEFSNYARVQKPLAAFLSTSDISARGIARFGRDIVRRVKPAGSSANGWSLRTVDHFDATVEPVLPKPGVVSEIVCFRDAALLNYFLKCPAGRMEGLLFYNQGQLAGYGIVAYIRDECRLAEIWIDSPRENDWTAAFLLAMDHAAGASGVTRTVLGVSAKIPQLAAQAAGAYLCGRQPIYIKEPKSLLPETLDLSLGMLDTDAFYL
jgi:hypothetical protein